MTLEATETEAVGFLPSIFRRLRGGDPVPARAPWKTIVLAGLGAVSAIGLVAGLTEAIRLPLVLGSFGATCVLVFGFPDVPFSQPRNIVAGHVLSSLIGLICLGLFGPHPWAVGLAVGFAVVAMMATRTVHPPAGSNPVIVFLAAPDWSFLVAPTLVGAILVAAVALIWNNATRPRNWPRYW